MTLRVSHGSYLLHHCAFQKRTLMLAEACHDICMSYAAWILVVFNLAQFFVVHSTHIYSCACSLDQLQPSDACTNLFDEWKLAGFSFFLEPGVWVNLETSQDRAHIPSWARRPLAFSTAMWTWVSLHMAFLLGQHHAVSEVGHFAGTQPSLH